MRLTTFTLFIAALLALGTSAPADTIVAKFTVDAGDVPRRSVPVVARVEAKGDYPQGVIWEVISGNDIEPAVPAHVERLPDGALLARWVEPDLQPGKPKTYELVATAEKAAGDAGGFRFTDGEGWRDLSYADKGVYRHMNRFDPADHHNTFKPFHHVFGMHGEGFITNGPGSDEWGTKGEGIRFPHHRGLFFAYNKTPYGDFWHGSKGVSQRHKAYKKDREITGLAIAREASVNEWTTADGKPVIRDTRELTTWRVDDTTYVLDFDVTLESMTGEAISLSGDAQHAGFHFRAANSVGLPPAPATKPTAKAAKAAAAETATKPTTRGNTGGNAEYTRPATAVRTGSDVWDECPWVYAAFTIKGHPYGVSEMNAPTNPEPTVFSTRPYGRFGAFVNNQTVGPDKPLKLTYRFVIRDATETPDPEVLEAEYQNWVKPVKVTVVR